MSVTSNALTFDVTQPSSINANEAAVNAAASAAAAASSASAAAASVAAALVSVPDGTAAAPSVAFGSDPDTGLYRISANVLGFAGGGTKRGAIDASGAGTIFYLYGDGGQPAVLLERYSNDISACGISARKARGTMASPTPPSSGDFILQMQGQAWDGSAYKAVASIECKVGTFTGPDDVSGYLTFKARSTGAAASLAERARIYDDGGMQVGGSYGTSPGAGVVFASGGIRTKVNAGVPSGGGSGDIWVDSTNSRIYCNVAGTWKYAALT